MSMSRQVHIQYMYKHWFARIVWSPRAAWFT